MKKGTWMKIRADYWGIEHDLQRLKGKQLREYLNLAAWAASWGTDGVCKRQLRGLGIPPRTYLAWVELGLLVADDETENRYLFNRQFVRWEAKGKAKTTSVSGRYTYVIQAEGGGPGKIGSSNNPQGRLMGLQTSHHERLVLLGVWEGGNYERTLHARYAEFRLHGEWFHEDILPGLIDGAA